MSKATIMLAKVMTEKLIDAKALYSISEKLDGQPVCITNNKGVLTAVSRQDKAVTSINHILTELQEYLPEGRTIVGEVYVVGKGSAEISGLVRRDEPCVDLKLHLFPEFTSELVEGYYELEHTVVIPHMYIFGDTLLTQFKDGSICVGLGFQETLDKVCLNHYTDDAFEGYIARKDETKWSAGKRSNNYLKIIQDPTMDMLVLDVEEAVSKSGEPLGRVGAFIVKWGDGTTKVGAGKLSHKEATQLWNDYKLYGMVPMIIEVKYKKDAKYTAPRQPTFQRFRYDKDTYETEFPNG